jgi:hypothetical protein
MTQTGVLGTFCWKGWCRDTRVMTPAQAFRVPQTFEMKLVFATQLDLSGLDLNIIVVDASMILGQIKGGIVAWEPRNWGEQRHLSNDRSQSIPMNLPAGQYIINVGSWWVGGGDASYSFRLDVSPTNSP